MRIGEPARKHGVADEDIHHATRCRVLDIDGDDPVVVHAMTLRRKFYKFPG